MFVHNFCFLTCFCNPWAFAVSCKRFLNFSVCYHFAMKRLYPEEQNMVVSHEKIIKSSLSCHNAKLWVLVQAPKFNRGCVPKEGLDVYAFAKEVCENQLDHSRTQVLMIRAAAAATAKLLQSCPTLCDPIDGSPPGSPVPGILQVRTLEWVAVSFSNAWKWKVKVKSLSRVRLLATPWTAAYQAPQSMGFSRLEYWSGVPLPR